MGCGSISRYKYVINKYVMLWQHHPLIQCLNIYIYLSTLCDGLFQAINKYVCVWHKTQKWWFWKKSYLFSSILETFKKVQNKLCDFVSHYTFFQFNNTVWWYWWCEVIVFQRIMMRFFLHEIKETKGQLWSISTDFKGTFIIIIIAIMYFCIPTYIT